MRYRIGERGRVTCGSDHPESGCHEAGCDRLADPAARAGHDCEAAVWDLGEGRRKEPGAEGTGNSIFSHKMTIV